MYFPVAGVEVSLWLPPAVAFAISIFTSMAGVSGAFLILPFQMSVLGFNGPAVSATNHLFNVVATPAAVWRYSREGRMVWPLIWIIFGGALPGVLIGVLLRITYLSRPGSFQLFVGAVLFYLGGKLVMDLMRQENGRNAQKIAEEQFQKAISRPDRGTGKRTLPKAVIQRFDSLRLVYEFCGQKTDLSVPRLMLLSLAVGAIGGIYGIGGGAFIAPFLVTFFGIPIYIAAGAALMGTFATSLAAVVFFQLLAPLYPNVAVAPDWALGLLFGLGGMAGMYCGARLQKFMPARVIKAILALCLLLTASLQMAAA